MLVIDGWLMFDTDSTRIKRGQSPEPLLSSVTFGYDSWLRVDNDNDRRNDKVDDNQRQEVLRLEGRENESH